MSTAAVIGLPIDACAASNAQAVTSVESLESTMSKDLAIQRSEGASQPADQPRRAVRRVLPPAERQALIEQHMPLVRYVTNSMARHVGQSVLLDYDDLLSYGCEGLIAAVDSFDPTRGVKFSTWAVMHIRTTIQDALRALDPLPRSLRAKGKEIERVSAELAHQRGEWPETSQVATALGLSLESLQRTQQDLAHTVVSLEQIDAGRGSSGDEGGLSLLNLIADDDPEGSPEERLDRLELSRMVGEAVAALPAREQTLIEAHYRQGMSMRLVSRMLGVSESRVSQLHARAVRLMQEHLRQALTTGPRHESTVAGPSRAPLAFKPRSTRPSGYAA
jgi:RNA polymerase sigma factor for flagellar operon FliA